MTGVIVESRRGFIGPTGVVHAPTWMVDYCHHRDQWNLRGGRRPRATMEWSESVDGRTLCATCAEKLERSIADCTAYLAAWEQRSP